MSPFRFIQALESSQFSGFLPDASSEAPAQNRGTQEARPTSRPPPSRARSRPSSGCRRSAEKSRTTGSGFWRGPGCFEADGSLSCRMSRGRNRQQPEKIE